MDPTRMFRHRLAARIFSLLGAASIALPPAGCNGDNSAILDAPGGGGGAGGGGAVDAGMATSSSGTGGATSTAAGTGGTGGTTAECVVLPPHDCPMDESGALSAVQNVISADGCPPTGWKPIQVGLPPTVVGGACCYVVTAFTPCGSGRPYLVENGARVAAAERGAGTRGWSEGKQPSLTGLSREDREALAAAWTADALLEHASVASFARASLALLAMGAPAELVELTHRAALDEVRHARLCFGLAAAYAGEDVAPGPFPLGGDVSVEASLADLAVSTFKEGCLGETVAAVIAAEQLARATDAGVVAALAQIAADEARHAELAWKTVAWAVCVGGSEVSRALGGALCEALAAGSVGRGLDAAPREVMEAHGRLDAATAARVTASVMAEIVAPAARALLQRDGGPCYDEEAARAMRRPSGPA